MSKKLIFIFALIISTNLASSVLADVKIKSKQTMSGQSYENTTYIKGKRQRTETMNGMMVSLTQCDLRRGIQINPNAKTYVVNPFTVSSETVTAAKPASVDRNGVVQAGGTVTTTITVKDTGERKQMFGFNARHLIITMETASSADACNKTRMKMETDGWYIDFEPQFDCGDSASYSAYNGGAKRPSCQDKYVMKTNGTAKRGYPVYEKMTMFDESGKETMSYVNEVVELSKSTLDVSLFDVPQGYREVSDASQMYASAAPTSMGLSSTSMGSTSPAASSMPLPNSSGPASSLSVGTESGRSSSDEPVAAKRPGTIRIGLAAVKTGAVGDGVTAADLAAAVQNTLTSYLKLPNVEVVVLDSRLASALQSEAQEKDCDYVINATVSHKKGGGGFGSMFGSALGSAVGRVGIGHTGSTVGNVAGQVATNAIVSATSVSSQMKSKDEITLDLKLNSASGSNVLARNFKAKAKSNGDDIISGVIEQAAQAVADTITK